MNKKVFLIFILVFSILLPFKGWDNSYAPYMPYMPYQNDKPVFGNDPMHKIIYNLEMHNYEETYSIFKENTSLISIDNIVKYLETDKDNLEFNEQITIYVSFAKKNIGYFIYSR